MKILKNLIVLLGGVIVLCACSGASTDTTSVEEVAKAYQIAVTKFDFSEADKYATDKTKKMHQAISGMIEAFGGEDLEEIKKANISVSNCECEEIDIDRQKCIVSVLFNGESKDDSVFLSKVDNVWKVDMSKEDAMGDSIEDAMGDLEDLGEEFNSTFEDMGDSIKDIINDLSDETEDLFNQ